MPAVSPQGNINDSGFTVLQDGGDNPEVDIIFVHGLQGHPQKTWSAVKKEYTDATTRKESKQEKTTFLGFLQRLSGAKEIHADCKEEPESIFWPRDLLPQDESCASARIMTYGYDSSIIRFVDTVNFSTISGQAETLLNAVTRIRQKCQRRPLIFITHSLGGPIVKAVRDIHSVHRVIIILADQRAIPGFKLILQK
ncbi:hypothetical protein BDV36DRAFT_133106 [Aspergillus pseudocaelatus]|uniref:DUF676 domain-containing protein n=1 Tax=Aspergillus pseudocaelatus TaxID=1825620 RepID=A0ABQ6X248_9EURO|nr:hypothetical protein BDV36DRAFT_133106 [Aspergillus pseudocaelatus]